MAISRISPNPPIFPISLSMEDEREGWSTIQVHGIKQVRSDDKIID
jgi:hypothetical protein